MEVKQYTITGKGISSYIAGVADELRVECGDPVELISVGNVHAIFHERHLMRCNSAFVVALVFKVEQTQAKLLVSIGGGSKGLFGDLGAKDTVVNDAIRILKQQCSVRGVKLTNG